MALPLRPKVLELSLELAAVLLVPSLAPPLRPKVFELIPEVLVPIQLVLSIND